MFEWDARNQLISVAVGDRRSDYAFDGAGHRSHVITKVDDSVISQVSFVWTGDAIAEEREAGTIRRFFALGEQIGATEEFVVKDHLGHVHAVTSTNATVGACMHMIRGVVGSLWIRCNSAWNVRPSLGCECQRLVDALPHIQLRSWSLAQ